MMFAGPHERRVTPKNTPRAGLVDMNVASADDRQGSHFASEPEPDVPFNPWKGVVLADGQDHAVTGNDLAADHDLLEAGGAGWPFRREPV